MWCILEWNDLIAPFWDALYIVQEAWRAGICSFYDLFWKYGHLSFDDSLPDLKDVQI